MKSNTKKLPVFKSPLLVFLENTLLVVILALMIFRSTYIENPHIEQIQTQFYLTSEIVSLLMSTLLLVCIGLWLLVVLLTNQFRWRTTWMGIGAGLFILAGIIAFWGASDKRAAVTDGVLLITPMLCAMLLVQLMTTRPKMHLAVIVVMAVALMMTVQCIDQLANSNEMVIQDYERNPAEHLASLNIEPDSLEQWMYEHRLYSKDIRGFLLTGNSAAAFFVLSMFAASGLCIEAFRRRKESETLPAFVCYCLVFVFAAGGLALTHSKGGIGSLLIGLIVLGILGVFGRRLWKHRVVVGIILLIGILTVAGCIIAYGVQRGRLPGGNSMLVRWQYWQSTASMIADHFWTGIGGGNFQFIYPQYKNAAASETIQDPHNFILSLLSQYGPLGLLGFLVAVLWPLMKNLQQQYVSSDLTVAASQRFGKKHWLGLLGVCLFLLLFIRPMLVDITFWYQEPEVRSAAYVVLYLFPAGVFVLGFGVLGAVATGDKSIQYRRTFLSLALMCGVLAVLIHNLVDFALFETGVWNTFWLLLAALAAGVHNNDIHDERPIQLSAVKRLSGVVILLAVAGGYLYVVVIPPFKANRLFRRALMTETPQFNVLDKAIEADTLAPSTAYNASGMLTQMYNRQRPLAKDPMLLEKAAEYAEIAQQRNPGGFKPYRLQSDIAMVRAAQTQDDADREQFLRVAYESLLNAAKHYPGSGRIYFNLGQIAEQLNQPQAALEHYQKAMAIEQAYQAQFKIMYPDRTPVISRLGNTACTITQSRIEALQKQSENANDPAQ